MDEYKSRPPNLWEASENGDVKRVEELLSLTPPNPDGDKPSRLPYIWNVHMWGNRPICLAAANGHTDVVDCLLNHKADVDANNGFPLRWAASEGHINVVKLLVENKANVHAQEDTALVWAVEQEHGDVVFYLLSRGANPRAQNSLAIRSAKSEDVLAVFQHFGIEPVKTDGQDNLVVPQPSPYKWCTGWC